MRDASALGQGGLHHLSLMDDLEQALSEIHRVLKPEGRLLIIEPWLTPFLRIVHALCRVGWIRRSWNKMDALAAMIELEWKTYDDWLRRPAPVLSAIRDVAEPTQLRMGWGKLMLTARKRSR